MDSNGIQSFFESEQWKKIRNSTVGDKNRIFSSTRLEDMIYKELREDVDIGLDDIEKAGSEKLNTFPDLLRDVFQIFYSLLPKQNAETELTNTAKSFSREILKAVQQDEKYPVLKNICEGDSFLSYETIMEFVSQINENLDSLISKEGRQAANILNTLEKQLNDLKDSLEEKRYSASDNNSLSPIINKAVAKQQQIEKLTEKIRYSNKTNRSEIQSFISASLGGAKEKAEQMQILLSWGNNSISHEAYKVNAELIMKAKNNKKVMDVLKYVGKFREMAENTRKNSFSFGRGEIYDVCKGNNYTNALSSEYAYLTVPETQPLFLKKIATKSLLQYRKRESTSKGHGDCIIMIDESGSMRGEPIAWAKALAITLMEETIKNKQKCALIRFSGMNQCCVHEFQQGEYTFVEILAYIDGFIGGGTDFKTPLNAAQDLIGKVNYKNTDLIILSDGDCPLDKAYIDEYKEAMVDMNYTLTTVLLGTENTSTSLEPLSKKIILGKDVLRDDIAKQLVNQRI